MSDKIDNRKEKKGKGLSRRDFMVAGAITTAALATPFLITNLGQKSMADATQDKYDTDILVIGTGFAGTFAAMEARKQGHRVVMVDKGTVGFSGYSPWASDSRPFDPTIYSRQEWIDNMAINTEWVNDRKWLDIFMNESMDIYNILHGWGVHEVKPFERSKVFREQLENAGVTLVERTMITRLIQDKTGRVAGAVGFTYDDSKNECKAMIFRAKAVVMCSGAGGYKSPGFPIWGMTFDGDAMAYQAGATISGKEYHDTHMALSKYPAASYEGWKWAQSVIGAYIMVGPPPRLDGGLNLNGILAVSEHGVNRVAGGSPTGGHAPKGPNPEEVSNRKYLGKGFLATPGLTLDLGGPPKGADRADLGYRVGGATAGMGVHKGEGVFSSDYTGAADGVEGLYAAGDAMCSMLAGSCYPARGFASYGSAMQGRRAASFASEYIKTAPAPKIDPQAVAQLVKAVWAPREVKRGFSPEWVTQVLRNTMTPYHILYIKEPRRLDGALASIEYLREKIVPRMIARDGHELRLAHETAHMLLNAEMKLRAGIFRTESRGTHYREDYPARNDKEWLCWTLIKNVDGKMTLSKHFFPKEWNPPKDMPYRVRYPRVYPGEDEYLANHPELI